MSLPPLAKGDLVTGTAPTSRLVAVAEVIRLPRATVYAFSHPDVCESLTHAALASAVERGVARVVARVVRLTEPASSA